MVAFRGIASRIVAASSMDVYRACGVFHGSEDGPLEPVPLTEESPLRTKLQTYPPAQLRILQRLFGWLDEAYDKIPVERAVLGDRELPGTVLRLPMIYGPGDLLRRFHPVLKRIDDGRRVIPFEEGIAQWRSPRGYVENVAAAIALSAVSEHATGRIYNVAETPVFSELDWARKIAAATGWDGEFVTPAERAGADTPAATRQQRAALGSGLRPHPPRARVSGTGDGGRSPPPHHRLGARKSARRIDSP
jgi:nucleoside-diphosphate-sugar epimerase